MGGSDLHLDDVTDKEEALYTCSVASILGMSQQSAWLTVLPAEGEYTFQTYLACISVIILFSGTALRHVILKEIFSTAQPASGFTSADR